MDAITTAAQSELVRLELERQQITDKLASLRVELRSLAEPTADEADVDAYEREKTWALIQSLQYKLESIQRAIHVVETGSYGICQACGERIDPARLEILPQAMFCLRCQRQIEQRNRRARH